MLHISNISITYDLNGPLISIQPLEASKLLTP